jgi:branched-chain amino acid transport system permease protein
VLDVVMYGLINGAILALIATGFTLCYSVSRLPNFAHGALYILTGLFCWYLFNRLGLNYAVAVLCSIALTAVVGAIIYRFAVIRVRGMEASEIILTFAFAIAIMETLRFLGFAGPQYTLPTFISGSLGALGVAVDYHRLFILLAAALLILALWLFTHHTKVGLALRAIAQDERAAMMLGIDSDLAATFSLSLGSALAAIAAIIVLPLGAITVEHGYHVLIMALAIAIIGGLGSTAGTILSSFVLGLIQQATMKYVGTQYGMVVFLVAIVVILLIKPSGLLGRTKELEERV